LIEREADGRLAGEIINFVRLNLEKHLNDTTKIVQGDGFQPDMLPDLEPFQISEGRDLGVSRGATHRVASVQKQFGQVSAILA
jgi:hypothetical protein